MATFKTEHNGPFRINTDELESARFFSFEELKEIIATEKVHPELLFLLKKEFNM